MQAHAHAQRCLFVTLVVLVLPLPHVSTLLLFLAHLSEQGWPPVLNVLGGPVFSVCCAGNSLSKTTLIPPPGRLHSDEPPRLLRVMLGFCRV